MILHLAIVNEDPAMVKYLLDKGADVSAQVCGNFFTPDDQKSSRSDCLDHEWVDLCKETNYEGSDPKLFLSMHFLCVLSFIVLPLS